MIKSTRAKHEGKPLWRIWEVNVNGRKFEIDGQNRFEDTKEWEVLEVTETEGWSKKTIEEREWIDTVSTKREALELIDRIIS